MTEDDPTLGTKPARKRTAYMRERRKHAMTLYFKDPAEKELYEGLAREAGYHRNPNGYILQMLANARSGAIVPPEVLEGLRKDVEKLKEWLDQAREENAELRSENRLLRREASDLRVLVAQEGIVFPTTGGGVGKEVRA